MNLSPENIPRLNRHRQAGGAAFGDVTYPEGGTLGPRVQQDYQLVVLLEGHAGIEVDGASHHLGAQQAAVLLPGRLERFRFAAPTRHTWCALHPGQVPELLRADLERLTPPFAWSARPQALLEHGLNFPLGATPEAARVLEPLALTLLSSVAFEGGSDPATRALPPALEAALLHIEAYLHTPLSVQNLAGAVGLSPQHLGRLFGQHLHTSPMRHVWTLRLERGVELLRSTGLSVTAIAERLGFGSPFHFSRRVREQVGMSPRALRQAAWRGEPSPE